MAGPVRVDVVSDVMCPWCYIGKRRLEKALTLVPDIPVDVHWQPFQLDATIPPEGMDRQAYLERKFGGKKGVAGIYDPIKEAGEKEGLAFDFDAITISPNTLNAHRVIRWADTSGLQNQMAERLFQLYFEEGANLTDKEVLSDAAADAGMEREVVARLLDGDADLAETRHNIATAQKMGITGVPAFIIAGRYAVLGAQTAEVIAAAIEKAASEMASQPAPPN